MASGNFEHFPGFDPERQRDRAEKSRNIEREPTPEELLEVFESGKRFDDEDEKARQYNAMLDAADEAQAEIQKIDEAITVKSQQLMGLSLTPEQQRLLYEIEQLTAKRKITRNRQEQTELDEQIRAKTNELTSLPVTPEQGGLLDEILSLMNLRNSHQSAVAKIFDS